MSKKDRKYGLLSLAREAWHTAEDKGWHEVEAASDRAEQVANLMGLRNYAAFAFPRLEGALDEVFGPQGERSIGESIALMHTELSEAFEDYRDGYDVSFTRVNIQGKPEGYLVEMADLLIRIMEHIAHLKLTPRFIEALELKLEYNKTREHRHGGKKI